MNGKGKVGIVRATSAEFRRLGLSPMLVYCLFCALLPALPLLTALAQLDGDVTASQSTALGQSTAGALLQGSAFGAAAFGALRTATAFDSGVLARDVLLSGTRPALVARFAAAATSGAVLAAVVVFMGAGMSALCSTGHVLPTAGWIVAAPLVGCWGGIWGALCGTIVRLPLFVLFAALGPLSITTLVTESGLREAMPLAILETTARPTIVSACAGIAWLLLLLAIAYISGRRRPLL